DPAPKFFALIVGINDYPEIKPLKGAVPDAQAVAEYLREYLDIPDDHIAEIYNEKATRAGIIQAFRNLCDDERIEKDDAILIFYAGHGGEVEAPEGWETDGQKIQGLIPYDVRTLDITGRIVEIIPDRTVGSLLEDLAEAKGDNITVIFDCCHSASGTRASEDPQARLVDSKDLPPLSSDTDKYIIRQPDPSTRAAVIPAGFAHRGLRSHVLLAACMATEVAWEREGRGEFTSAILSILKNTAVDKMTYTELKDSLPKMIQQNPQCEGENKTRILFNNKLAGASPIMTRVEIDEDIIKLHAGFAQGVTKGARFDIYQHHLNDPMSNPCLATLEVTAVLNFHSVLTATGDLPQIQNPAYARQVSPGRGHEIKVYVFPALQEKLQGDPEWRDKFLSDDSSFVARPTFDISEADLSLDLRSDNRVTYDTHNKISNEHGITRLPETTRVDVKQILAALQSAAAWDWHVGRTNPDSPFKDDVRIEVFRVKEDLTKWNPDGRRPLIPAGENLNTNGVAEIFVDPTHYYGYRIVNDTALDLYPYLFYFDASKLSIEHYYLGPLPGSGRMDVPLRQKGYMSVGFGSSGVVPFAYCLGEDQKFDVGIIKLFVTTSSVNFGLLEQESPFEEGGRGNERKVIVRSRLASVQQWDTQSMALVQRSMLPEPKVPEPELEPASAPKPDSKVPSAPIPIVQPAAAQLEGVLNGRYGLWVVFPAALALSCVPFVVFYLFIMS
ncbi:hypothetical protein FRC07_002546, partial [Ceratobasidium sp. 392]